MPYLGNGIKTFKTCKNTLNRKLHTYICISDQKDIVVILKLNASIGNKIEYIEKHKYPQQD